MTESGNDPTDYLLLSKSTCQGRKNSSQSSRRQSTRVGGDGLICSRGGLVDRSDFSLQGWMKIDSCPRTYDGLLAIFMPIFLESIVFSSYFFEICNAEMSDMCLGSDPQPYE